MWAFPLRAADQAERGEREVESGNLLPSPLPLSWGIERAEITLSPSLGEGKEGAEIVLPLLARRERERERAQITRSPLPPPGAASEGKGSSP